MPDGIIILSSIHVFFIYQFASLNKSEQEISQIYNQQLETIIFSINQYSEDIINSWANEIKGLIKSKQELDWENFFTENSSVKNIFVVDKNIEEFQSFSDLSFNMCHAKPISNALSTTKVVSLVIVSPTLFVSNCA